MTESIMWERYIKPYLRDNGVIFYQRIENAVSVGFPDCLYINPETGVTVYIEVKARYKKQCFDLYPDYRPGQLTKLRKIIQSRAQGYVALWYEGEMYILPPDKRYNEAELKELHNYYVETEKLPFPLKNKSFS